MNIVQLKESVCNIETEICHLHQLIAAETGGSVGDTAHNTASQKLPADIVEGFHTLLAKHRSNMWSSEQHIMDQVASFIGR